MGVSEHYRDGYWGYVIAKRDNHEFDSGEDWHFESNATRVVEH
jgi:hypothetical protein